MSSSIPLFINIYKYLQLGGADHTFQLVGSIYWTKTIGRETLKKMKRKNLPNCDINKEKTRN